jgi:hypothetical protein
MPLFVHWSVHILHSSVGEKRQSPMVVTSVLVANAPATPRCKGPLSDGASSATPCVASHSVYPRVLKTLPGLHRALPSLLAFPPYTHHAVAADRERADLSALTDQPRLRAAEASG